MARTSLAEAKTEMFERLVADAGAWTVDIGDHVYGHEPKPGDIGSPYAVTVSTAGMGPTDYRIAVRLYATGEVGAERAQTDLDSLMIDVDFTLADPTLGRAFGASDWDVEWIEDIACFVATCEFEIGREDPGF